MRSTRLTPATLALGVSTDTTNQELSWGCAGTSLRRLRPSLAGLGQSEAGVGPSSKGFGPALDHGEGRRGQVVKGELPPPCAVGHDACGRGDRTLKLRQLVDPIADYRARRTQMFQCYPVSGRFGRPSTCATSSSTHAARTGRRRIVPWQGALDAE